MIVYYTFQDGGSGVGADRPSFVSAFKLTLIAVLIAVPANTIFGVACAMALVRRPPKHGTWLINSLIGLPLALSPVVVGLALILVYGQDGWFGSWLTENGIQIIFSTPGIVLATIFVTLPFVVREVIPVLREVGTDQDEAAWTLGASRFQTFRRVTLPAIRWGVAYGVVLTTAGPSASTAPSRSSRAHRRQDRDAHAARGRGVPALQRGRRVHDVPRARASRRAHPDRHELFKPKEHKEVADVDRRPPGHEAV